MLIAKVSLSYDRGIQPNKADELGLESKPALTEDGKPVRGLGTHFRSEEARVAVLERDNEASRIRTALRSRFIVTPMDGVYTAPGKGDVRSFIESLGVREDVEVKVSEFTLVAESGLEGSELQQWVNGIQKQLNKVSLGRGKQVDEKGLESILSLADCPLLGEETREELKRLAGAAKLQSLDRIQLKRSLSKLKVTVEPGELAPRRMPKLAQG